MPNETKLLAVLIDADNTSPQWAEAIFEEIASLGEASVRRIYGDFSSNYLKGWAEKLATLALVPHQQFANTIGKNSSDIALVIDAMDILHTGRFDGFVLISSDSDFTRLASRIREQGVDVYGIGQQKTPAAFRNACKRFIYVENLISDAVPADKTAAKPVKRSKPEDARSLVLRAFDALDDEEWVSLGRLGQQITTANPDFDPRNYGKQKLSDLIQSLKMVELRQGENNQLQVRRLD
ncbi:MAG: hypothetical protein ACI9AX_001943 [Polaromonas sp.]|jgi:hypothetical protein